MDNEDVFFMNDSHYDYGLLARQLRQSEPREYKGVNYIIQAQNMDKQIAASLLEKSLEEYDWSAVEPEPITITTAEFKAMALSLNAAIFYGAGGHEHE